MLPFIAGFIILFFFMVGMIGLTLFYCGLNDGRSKKWNLSSIGKIVLGLLFLGFVTYNWIGYNTIYSENEKLILGEYKSASATLTINPDHTWRIAGNNKILCDSGKWEFIMSEDWCYWNIESNNTNLITQIGAPSEGKLKSIIFQGQNLTFERK